MLPVHVRVNDLATGKPTPVRIRLVDATGAYRPPLGRLADFRTGPGEDVGAQVMWGNRAFAFIDGTCEVPLAPGPVTVEISKGPEYTPVTQVVPHAAGQLSLRLAIGRWIDLREQGWYAGDVRAHDLPPHAALLEGEAEGLAVVQLLARERAGSISNIVAFSGTRALLRTDDCLVAVNTLNHHRVLGTLSLLHCHRPVHPLLFGSPEGEDDWSVAGWCDQCHRKKGLVVWPDLPRLVDDHLQGEALAALLLGKVDACEITSFTDPDTCSLSLFYQLLDAGARPRLVGGSGKDGNATVLGAVRTYAQLPQGQRLDADTWIEAVRAGRTFVTNGPLLSLNVAGEGPGSVHRVEPGTRLRLRVEAQSTIPFDHLEILAGGRLLASKPASGNRQATLLELDHEVTESTWIAARCHGSDRLPDGSCVHAHTSPVWLEVAGRPMRVEQETVKPLLDVLERTREWVMGRARCPEKDRQHLVQVIDEAREVLRLRTRGEAHGR